MTDGDTQLRIRCVGAGRPPCMLLLPKPARLDTLQRLLFDQYCSQCYMTYVDDKNSRVPITRTEHLATALDGASDRGGSGGTPDSA